MSKKNLKEKFKDKIKLLDNKSILVNHEAWEDISKFIYDSSFDYLMCITSYDLGGNNTFGLAYNFHSTCLKHYLEIRIEFEDNTEIHSVESIWKAADWHEREAFDMMGVKIINHPDMKRILLPQDWDGYPLRKDYKTPEYYNGMPVPKDKSYWE